MKSILLFNGSPSGSAGNTKIILDHAESFLKDKAVTSSIELFNSGASSHIEQIEKASGFVFGTGTYWDSWGSPLQLFLEEVTQTEATDLWIGKPCAVLVTMHAVGGKGILSRLQGVLNNFGLSIPPMTGMVYSMANHLALQSTKDPLAEELWRPSDVEIVCHNLMEAVSGTNDWRVWPTSDGSAVEDRWLKI